MDENRRLPSNSYASKRAADISEKKVLTPKEKGVKPVVTNKVVTKKKSAFEKFVRRFLAEDVDDIGEYLVDDLIIPGIKDVAINFVTALLGGGRGSVIKTNNHTPYHKMSTSSVRTTKSVPERRTLQSSMPTDESDILLLATRAEAENVLSSMYELLDMFQQVTMADLYELLELSCPYNQNYYGWYSLDGASVSRVRGGRWRLNLPDPVYLRG